MGKWIRSGLSFEKRAEEQQKEELEVCSQSVVEMNGGGREGSSWWTPELEECKL